MAEAVARKYGLDAESAGTMPADEVSQAAVAAMAEHGMDMAGARPKPLDFNRLADYEQIICMGPGVAATSPDLHFHEDWGIDDPVNMDFAVYRSVRDAIEAKVKAMALEQLEWSMPATDEDGALAYAAT